MRWWSSTLLIALLFSLCSHWAWGDVLRAGVIEIQYHPADAAIAQSSLEVLSKGVKDLSEHLPAGKNPIRVILCHSFAEFAHYAGPYAQVDISGIAEPEKGLIVVKSPSLQGQGSDYKGTLRHELVHVLLARNLNAPNLPRWLDEGLAMTLSGEHRWSSTWHVAQMYSENRTLTYLQLTMTLAAFPGEMSFGDAYAQSLSMTRFLRDKLGEKQFWALLRDLDHESFGAALHERTGWYPHDFCEAWKRSLWKTTIIFTIISGISLFQIAALLLIAAYWRKWRSGRRTIERWEEEEDEPLAPWEVFESEGPYPWEEEEDDYP